MPKFKRACLFLFIKWKGNWVAVLQRRGHWDLEKPWHDNIPTPESWAGGCQGLCVGKCEDNDGLVYHTLYREMNEELGNDTKTLFVSYAQEAWVEGSLPEDQKLDVVPGSQTAFVAWKSTNRLLLSTIRLHPSSGGLEFVTFEQLGEIQNLKDYPKHGDVPTDVVAMFPDELEALRKLWPKD